MGIEDKLTVEHKYPFKKGDEYWTISGGSKAFKSTWNNHLIDKNCYEMGNAYATKEEAEHAVEVQKARVRLQRKANFKPDWEDSEQTKTSVGYDTKNGCFHAETEVSIKRPDAIYFSSIVAASKSIKEDEADWKLVLGVESNQGGC